MNEEPQLDTNTQIAIRKEKLAELRRHHNAYPNDFRRENLAADIYKQYESFTKEMLEAEKITVSLAGRMMTRRIMGKASFIHIQDMSGKIQIYVASDELTESVYEDFKRWDIGDIVGLQGYLFRTKTNELTIRATSIHLLTKSLRPLPEKWHGLTELETRYRQRYLDLMVNEETRETFKKRIAIIGAIRQFLLQANFLEVETPMMHVIAGGAAARPFVTHHNALDMELYLRIAPELYLKRLLVGGFEQVFEINRNFRNEGLSVRHNPEFTMLEWYQAYADVNDGMCMTENLLRTVAQQVLGSASFNYQGQEYDFAKPFQRLSVKDAILHYNKDIDAADLEDMDKAKAIAARLNIKLEGEYGLGKVWIEIFEATAEHQLIAPTFITEYPAEISPLARCNDKNSFITDRFELFIGGREIANGFSELNDPEDQSERFKKQMQAKAAGDVEAMPYDEDYVIALEYGLPPACGVGIGIDRLVMLLTDTASIRDVILFPHMRHK